MTSPYLTHGIKNTDYEPTVTLVDCVKQNKRGAF